MPDKPLFESLPHTRPHRRSDKRPARPGSGAPEAGIREAGTPDAGTQDAPDQTATPPTSAGIALLGGAVQAAVGVVGFGLTTTARVINATVTRLPKP